MEGALRGCSSAHALPRCQRGAFSLAPDLRGRGPDSRLPGTAGGGVRLWHPGRGHRAPVQRACPQPAPRLGAGRGGSPRDGRRLHGRGLCPQHRSPGGVLQHHRPRSHQSDHRRGLSLREPDPHAGHHPADFAQPLRSQGLPGIQRHRGEHRGHVPALHPLQHPGEPHRSARAQADLRHHDRLQRKRAGACQRTARRAALCRVDLGACLQPHFTARAPGVEGRKRAGHHGRAAACGQETGVRAGRRLPGCGRAHPARRHDGRCPRGHHA